MTHDRALCNLGVIFFLLAAVAIADSEAAGKQYPIPGHGMLELDLPADIEGILDQPADGGPPAIALRPKRGGDFGVMVVVSWREPSDTDFGSDAYLQRVLKGKARPYLDQLGLSEVPLTRVSGGKNPGYACSMTDNSVVGKQREPGNFPYLRQGVVTTGDLLLTYMIFMYTRDPDPVPALEPIFTHARHLAARKDTR
ncbi:MAG: hypothetical protein ACYS0H_21915 [Planctomycetota bacterium]|jgi:hypothetical protein